MAEVALTGDVGSAAGVGGAYGIRTRGLRLERAVSLATRRMRQTSKANEVNRSSITHPRAPCQHSIALAPAVEGRPRFPYN